MRLTVTVSNQRGDGVEGSQNHVLSPCNGQRNSHRDRDDSAKRRQRRHDPGDQIAEQP